MTNRLTTRTLALLLAIGSTVPLGCGRQAGSEAPIGIGIRWMDGPGLPPGVTSLNITVGPYASTSSTCSPHSNAVQAEFPVTELTDLDGNGWLEAVMSDLPYGCPLFAEITGFVGATASYSARADGIVLETQGTRRFVEMTLTQKNAVTLLDSQLEEPAFGLTATPLEESDGRVLVAGGFTLAESVTCPTSYDSSHACFLLTATNSTYLFVQGSASALPARSPMSSRRALHTATRLVDGRVLLAGGVDRAMLVLDDGSADATWAGWEIVDIVPQPGGGFSGALNNYEIFDPEAGALAEDPERDGDPQRGAFTGSTPATAMTSQRFAHAAGLLVSSIPSINERRVLMVGGLGPAGVADTVSTDSIDVFRMTATGTDYGFITTGFGTTQFERQFPAVAIVNESAWVFGGSPRPGDSAVATKNIAIVEEWQPNDDGDQWNSAPVIFDGFDSTPKPELVRLFASAVELGTAGGNVLLVGWYGARCSDSSGSPTPTFVYQDSADPPAPIPTFICPPPDGTFGGTLDFVMNVNAAPITLTQASLLSEPHAFGSVLRLADGAHLGRVIVAGGVANVDFSTGDAIDIYTGEIVGGVAQRDGSFPASHQLNQGRAWAGAAELGGGNVLFAGGLQIDLSTRTLTVLDSIELLNWAD